MNSNYDIYTHFFKGILIGGGIYIYAKAISWIVKKIKEKKEKSSKNITLKGTINKDTFSNMSEDSKAMYEMFCNLYEESTGLDPENAISFEAFLN